MPGRQRVKNTAEKERARLMTPHVKKSPCWDWKRIWGGWSADSCQTDWRWNQNTRMRLDCEIRLKRSLGMEIKIFFFLRPCPTHFCASGRLIGMRRDVERPGREQ